MATYDAPVQRRSDGAGEAGHPAPARGRTSLAGLWFGLFGGFAAWTVQTLVNLPVAAHGCFPRLEPLGHPITSVRGIVLGVSLACVAASVAALAVALRAWTRTREEHQGSTGRAGDEAHGTAALETGEGRTRFMAMAGMMTSSVFVLVTLAHASTLFLVSPCGS